MSYNQTYGGGGSSGSNYYDSEADFTSQPAPSHPTSSFNDTFSNAISQAKYHHRGPRQDSSGRHEYSDNEDDGEDSSFFSTAIRFLNEHKDKVSNEDLDEGKAVGAHQQLYGGSGGSNKHDADSLGSGAAVQALKLFLSDDEKKEKTSGGHDQNKLIGIAMAQAGKLWDQQNQSGNVVSCFCIPFSPPHMTHFDNVQLFT